MIFLFDPWICNQLEYSLIIHKDITWGIWTFNTLAYSLEIDEKCVKKFFFQFSVNYVHKDFFFREIDLLRHWFFQKGNPSNNQYKMCADIPNLSFWKLELPKNKFGIPQIYPKKFCWVRFEGRFWFFGHFGKVRLLWLRKIMSHVDQKNNVLTIFLCPIWNDEVKF